MFDIHNEVLYQYNGNDTMVMIPQKILYISGGAFRNNDTLEKVVFPSTIMNIGEAAFSHTSLTELILPDSVWEIGARAFSSCTKLHRAYIPESVRCLQMLTFSCCERLVEVSLPYTLEAIDDTTFNDCPMLRTLLVRKDDNIITITLERELDNAYWRHIKSNICNCKLPQTSATLATPKTVKLPNSAIRVGTWAYEGQHELQRVVFPETLKEIGTGAFWKCSALRSIELPAQLVSIDGYAFGNCSTLAELTISDTVEEIGTDAFLGCNVLRTIHVRTGGETVTIELQQPFTEQQWPRVCEIAKRKLKAKRAERTKMEAINTYIEARFDAQEARIAAIEAIVASQQAQFTQLTEYLKALTPPRRITSFHPLSDEELHRL